LGQVVVAAEVAAQAAGLAGEQEGVRGLGRVREECRGRRQGVGGHRRFAVAELHLAVQQRHLALVRAGGSGEENPCPARASRLPRLAGGGEQAGRPEFLVDGQHRGALEQGRGRLGVQLGRGGEFVGHRRSGDGLCRPTGRERAAG
jgi:hypothetical protein